MPKEPSELEATFVLQLHERGITGWRREYRFHPTRRWRFDFAWRVEGVAVEIEGGTYVHGRHTRGEGFARDCEKYNAAAILGWKVLRFTEKEVNDWSAIETLQQALKGGWQPVAHSDRVQGGAA